MAAPWKMAILACATAAGLAGRSVPAAATNVPPSLLPPGGLDPAHTPQMITLTFDDSVTVPVFDTVQTVLTNRVNPNGTPVQATFFISTDWTDYWRVQRLYAAGHEIAVHTMSHSTGAGTDLDTWRAEIAGCRRTLSRLAKVPIADIRGFRAPFLVYSPASFAMLREQGFTYDSSISEVPGRVSQSAGQMLWPYTLDGGVVQDCWTGTPPSTNLPGLFEVPLWSLYDTNTAGWITMDPPGSDAQVLAVLQDNFRARYNGNRAPLGIFLHGGSWGSRTQVLRDFFDWAQAQPDVWIVSQGAATDFMRDPQSTAAAYTFPPFMTRTQPAVPESETRAVQFSKGLVRTCGEHPTAYPAIDTVFLVWAPLAGGNVSVEITGEWSTGFGAQVVISNDTPAQAEDWQASFRIDNASITWHNSGTWQIDGTQVVVTPSEPDPLAPGVVRKISFGGTKTDPFGFACCSALLQSPRQQRPEMQGIARTGGAIALAWDDSAFGYRLEAATNGLCGGWQPLADVHGGTCWTGAPPAGAGPVMYRIETEP